MISMHSNHQVHLRAVFFAGVTLLVVSPILLGALDAPAREVIESQPGRSLGIASVPNLQDLGGYKTETGMTVAKGLAYRSNQLSDIEHGDMKRLGALKLKVAYDLRTAEEKQKRPDELPAGVNYIWLNVLADSPQAGPAQLEPLLKDPKKVNAALGGGKAAQAFQKSYREFVSLPSARKEFRELFLALGEKIQLPAVFHCTTRKDRTGWAAAAFLTLLRVPRDVVVQDYLRSNDYIIPAYQKVIDAFIANGGDPSIPKAILGVESEYLAAAFDEMKKELRLDRKVFFRRARDR